MYTLNFQVSGLHCEACVKLITLKVKQISGVTDFSVSSDGEAKLTANREVNLNEVQDALKGTGYTVTM